MNTKSKPITKPEGGLEVIVDEYPYPRLRIRRCNIGPETIIKVESESIIIKLIEDNLQRLELDLQRAVK